MIAYTFKEIEEKGKLYAAGKMDLSEQIAFEEYLNAHPIQKMMVEGMVVEYHYFDGSPPKVLTSIQHKRRYLSIAASIVLILVVGGYFATRQTVVPSGQKLLTRGIHLNIPMSRWEVKTPPKAVNDHHQASHLKINNASQHLSKNTISNQQLATFNKQEIAYWEGELDLVTDASRSASGTVEVLAIDNVQNATTFKVRYKNTSKLFITIYSAKNMVKPLLDEVPLLPVESSIFSKMVLLPKSNTYYWQLTNEEEELFIGKLVK
ncbi:hypothetical protein [Microscilla marina]|uniref:Uncharacterized protein n=1 Tax=Microscilla marina ATCC 23134 TaxID=313606 RepID=A1ZUB0_MICM2|nr:hypothetical protein [Microscilla marina]EAY26081.1 hypothetical protein M23134_06430 [Microscilla marina ATCC 23134]